MTTVLKRVAPAAMAIGMALGAFAGTAGASTHASAKTTTTVHHAVAPKAHHAAPLKAKTAAVKTNVKAGSRCTKPWLGKSRKAGKVLLTCERVGKAYKWEVSKPAKK